MTAAVYAAGFNNIGTKRVLMSSADGATWAAIATPEDLGAVAIGWGIGWDGSGLIVLGGNGDNSVPTKLFATSPDGATWTARSSPLDGQTNALDPGIIWAGGSINLWVAAAQASPPNILTSPDGSTWTSQTTPFNPTGYVQSVAFDGATTLLACGNGSTGDVLMSSADGATWALATTPWDTNGWANFAVWDGTAWVVGGSDGTHTKTIMTSPDLTTWTQRSTPFEVGTYAGVQPQVFWLASDGAGTLAAAGQGMSSGAGSVVCTSTDHGATWTARTTPFDTNAGLTSYGSGNAIVWFPDASLWVLGCAGVGGSVFDVIATSPDGATWTARSSPFSGTGLGNMGQVRGMSLGPSGGAATTVTAADTLAALSETADAAGRGGARTAADTLDQLREAADQAAGPITVRPRPAIAGAGPAQTATPAGAGGIGGGVDLPMRIIAWDCTVADEGASTLSFTLAKPPPGKAPTPPALYFPQLLAQLQQQVGTVSTAISIPPVSGGGGGGFVTGVQEITSTDGTVSVTGGAGPVADLSVPDVDPGSSGGYLSLTGAGQAATPGDLTQAGGLTVNAPVTGSMGIQLVTHGVGGVNILNYGNDGINLVSETGSSGGISLTNNSSSGITLTDNGSGGGISVLAGQGGAGVLDMAGIGFGGTAPNIGVNINGQPHGSNWTGVLIRTQPALGGFAGDIWLAPGDGTGTGNIHLTPHASSIGAGLNGIQITATTSDTLTATPGLVVVEGLSPGTGLTSVPSGRAAIQFISDGFAIVTPQIGGSGGYGPILIWDNSSSGGIQIVSANSSILMSAGNGHFEIDGLPTVSPGGSGLLWNNGGVLNIT